MSQVRILQILTKIPKIHKKESERLTKLEQETFKIPEFGLKVNEIIMQRYQRRAKMIVNERLNKMETRITKMEQDLEN